MPGSDKLCWLDVQTFELHEQKPEKVMRRKDYYRQQHVPNEIDEFCFEKKLSEFYEAHIADWIHRLIHDVHSFTQDGMRQFIHHIELQYLRVPAQHQRAIDEIKQVAENIHIDVPGLPKGFVKDNFKVSVKDSHRFAYMHEMLLDGIIQKCLSRMDWNVRKAADGVQFLTSDNPITIFNPGVLDPCDARIEQIGSILIYPLTPSWCLYLSHPENSGNPKHHPLQLIPPEPCRTNHIAHKIMSPENCHFCNFVIARSATRVVAAINKGVLQDIYEKLRTEEGS